MRRVHRRGGAHRAARRSGGRRMDGICVRRGAAGGAGADRAARRVHRARGLSPAAQRAAARAADFGVRRVVFLAGLRARGRDVRAQQLLSDAAVDLQAGIRAERIHEGHRPRHSDRRAVCLVALAILYTFILRTKVGSAIRCVVAEPDEERAARYPRKQDHHDDVFRRRGDGRRGPGRCSPSSTA